MRGNCLLRLTLDGVLAEVAGHLDLSGAEDVRRIGGEDAEDAWRYERKGCD